MPFPTTLESITADWLTDTLKMQGVLPDGRVTRVELRPVREPGQVSTASRLLLDLENANGDTPRMLVAKVATALAPVRQSALALGLYEREVRFYREFGADAGIAVPRCYFADIDLSTGDFLLLLEDLSESRPGDFWVSSVPDVTLAIDALASFHARWWRSPALRGMAWLQQPDNVAYQQMLGSVLRACLPAMQQRWPARCAGYLGRVSTRLAERWEAYVALPPDAPWTLVHTDFHPKQMFFPTASGGRFAVFDWQAAAVGRGESDLARIIVTGLRPPEQAEHQEALIARYHAGLAGAGVDYPLDVLREETRRAMLTSLFILIYAVTSTDMRILQEAANARGVDLEDRFFGDMERSLERNQVLELIP